MELAALAIARELVEFAVNYNIVDDGGIDDSAVLEEENQLAQDSTSSISTTTTTSTSLPPSLQLLPVKLPCSFAFLSSSCINEATVLAAVAAASSVVDDEEEEPVLKLSRVNSDEVSVSTQDSSPPTPSSISSSSTLPSSSSSTSELELLPPTLSVVEEQFKFDGGAVGTLPVLHSRTVSDSLFSSSAVFPLSSPIILPKHFPAHPPSSLVEFNDFFQLESL